MRPALPTLCLLLLACKDSSGGDSAYDSGAAVEDLCDGYDQDGDGQVDEDAQGEVRSWWRDVDGDGFGDDANQVEACEAPSSIWVEVGGDCDDARAAIHPDAVEACDGLDNDCDGEVDGAAAEGWVDWLPDADGDGYGDDGAAPVASCEQPGSGYAREGGDCDDADAAVHPGATELCNSLDDDCDSSTGEEGTALFLPGDGGEEDWTGALAGRFGRPATKVVSRPGTLRLCEGTRYASLRVRADLNIEGVGEASEVRLSGGGAAGVIILRTDGVSLSLAGLSLIEGEGSGAVLGEFTAGGALECDAEASVTGEDLIIRDSAAGVGGGVFVRGCTVTLTDTRLADNEADHYGGAVAVLDGALTLSDAQVSGNLARYGGGLAGIGVSDAASLSLQDTLLEDNEALIEGGGAILEQASLRCSAAPSLTAGLLRNTALSGGGVYVAAGGQLLSSGCDWGSGGDANTPEDVSVDPNTRWGEDADFSCDEEVCSP